MKKYNLVVVGGGFSGVAAAISAARSGLSVLLVEKSNCLGGAATNCLVNPFMPYSTKIDGENVDLSRGIFREVNEELRKFSAQTDKAIHENNVVFHEEYLKIILNRMALASNVELLFHAVLSGAEKKDERIMAVTLATKSGNINVEADYFVDATGDADLAVLGGGPAHIGREKDNLCQPMTLCFRLANVNLKKFSEEHSSINEIYKKFQSEGKIKNPREDVLIFQNILKDVLHFNSTRVVKMNPVDAVDVTKAEIEAREQVLELYQFLKNNFECFKNSQLLSTASQIGVRESRMIDGEYVLTENDLKECRKFDDSIALGNYDIDIHNPEGSGTSHYYFQEGEYYTIPYRCLQPKHVNNLLVVGRCISATHEAQASIRIMPIVCCLGEAAGAAIAVAFENKKSVKEIDVKKLQLRLKDNGAAL